VKKNLMIGLVVAVALILSLGTVVLADSPTTVDVDWDGAGGVIGSVVAGDDAIANFYSWGNTGNTGQFNFSDSNSNPYNYGVDSCVASLDTSILGGGSAYLRVDRTDAKTSYGNPGQISYTYVGIADGAATLQNRSSTSYASMKDCNYGWNSSNHITVTGTTDYTLQRSMDGGWGNSAFLTAIGDGSATLDCMNAEASAGQVRLGLGCGCFTNADFTADGTSGVFEVGGTANTGANFAGMGLTYGSGVYGFTAPWSGSFSIADYSVTVN